MAPDIQTEMEKLAHDLTHIVLPLGVALSTEKEPGRLLEKILLEARSICNADAGLLFRRAEDDTLRLRLRRSVPLAGAAEDTTTKTDVSPPLHLYHPQTGEPNYRNVATAAALNDQSINIPDVYAADGYDFSGTKAFDQQYQYRTTSILAIPLHNHLDDVTGVFELINARNPATGQAIPFDAYHQLVAESLSSLATVALNNQRLLRERENMVEALRARNAELQTIYEIGQAISSSVELEKTLSYILDSIKSVIPHDAAEISLYNTATHKMALRTAAPNPADGRLYDTHTGIIGHLMEQNKGVLISNLAEFSKIEDATPRTWQPIAPQAYLGVPLKAKNKIIGVIELVNRQSGSFSQNNLRILESIAVQASVAIQNAQEVESRERRLKQEITELKIKIDETKRQAEVEQIVSTDYFQNLSAKAQRIRERSKRKDK